MKTAQQVKAKYLIDEKGNKKAVVMDIKDYESLMEVIEDLDDAARQACIEKDGEAGTAH